MQQQLNAFLNQLAKVEGNKSQVSIGDLREVLSKADILLDGAIYKAIGDWYEDEQGQQDNGLPEGQTEEQNNEHTDKAEG